MRTVKYTNTYINETSDAVVFAKEMGMALLFVFPRPDSKDVGFFTFAYKANSRGTKYKGDDSIPFVNCRDQSETRTWINVIERYL